MCQCVRIRPAYLALSHAFHLLLLDARHDALVHAAHRYTVVDTPLLRRTERRAAASTAAPGTRASCATVSDCSRAPAAFRTHRHSDRCAQREHRRSHPPAADAESHMASGTSDTPCYCTDPAAHRPPHECHCRAIDARYAGRRRRTHFNRSAFDTHSAQKRCMHCSHNGNGTNGRRPSVTGPWPNTRTVRAARYLAGGHGAAHNGQADRAGDLHLEKAQSDTKWRDIIRGVRVPDWVVQQCVRLTLLFVLTQRCRSARGGRGTSGAAAIRPAICAPVRGAAHTSRTERRPLVRPLLGRHGICVHILRRRRGRSRLCACSKRVGHRRLAAGRATGRAGGGAASGTPCASACAGPHGDPATPRPRPPGRAAACTARCRPGQLRGPLQHARHGAVQHPRRSGLLTAGLLHRVHGSRTADLQLNSCPVGHRRCSDRLWAASPVHRHRPSRAAPPVRRAPPHQPNRRCRAPRDRHAEWHSERSESADRQD